MVKAGSKSSIKHRSFNANPFAAQGTRPLLLVLEEIGLFSNLKDVYYHSVDALRGQGLVEGMQLVTKGNERVFPDMPVKIINK